jgi:hypothetical protein
MKSRCVAVVTTLGAICFGFALAVGVPADEPPKPGQGRVPADVAKTHAERTANEAAFRAHILSARQ